MKQLHGRLDGSNTADQFTDEWLEFRRAILESTQRQKVAAREHESIPVNGPYHTAQCPGRRKAAFARNHSCGAIEADDNDLVKRDSYAGGGFERARSECPGHFGVEKRGTVTIG